MKKLLTILLILSASAGASLLAQQNSYTFENVDLEAEAAPAVEHIHFNNLNEVDFYYNKKELNKIEKLEKQGDLPALKTALEDYVSQFGIENFSMDYPLLWRLAQLYEADGEIEKAKWLCTIILKNTEDDISLIAQYYSDLIEGKTDTYVPIEYYYELVDYRSKIDTLRPPRGVFLNMGNQVNSYFEDYGPSLSLDNNTLLFGSKRNRKTYGGEEFINEDVYWAQRDGDGWTEAEPLLGVNSPYNEGAPRLSRDGNTLYFVRCESPDGYGRCDIYTATKQPDGQWGDIQNLGENINSSEWDSHPALSHTEDTLYFVSDRKGGFGSNDIWFSYKNDKGQWQPAQNMGPVINTRGNDVSPFYHPIHKVLYFSSNGQLLNFGNFDIYKAHHVNGQWTEPKNIGPLVNGWGDEYFFTIDSRSDNLYYARSEKDDMNNLDLFSFPLPMGAQPMASTIFRGTLKDSVSGEAFDGIVSIIDLDNGIEVAPKYLREDGSFEFELINDNNYLLVIQGEDFFRVEELIDLQGDTTINIKTPSIDFKRIEFASIEFASASAEILPEMESDLMKLLDFMLDNPKMELVISGHTDSQGDADNNLQLSQKRADAIKYFLINKGDIEPFRITAIGYGQTKPIIKDEQTEEDRKINRRVEFEIIDPEKDNVGLNN